LVLVATVLSTSAVYTLFLGAGVYGYGAIPVADSGSMNPVMDGCDVAFYTSSANLTTGDIAIYSPEWESDFALVGHRVVEDMGPSYALSGDNVAGTEVVSKDAIRGEVVYVLRTRFLCH
jgi:hypothetical protein